MAEEFDEMMSTDMESTASTRSTRSAIGSELSGCKRTVKKHSMKQKMLKMFLGKYDPQSERFSDHYQLGALLGEGSFSQVYAARLRIRSRTYGKLVDGLNESQQRRATMDKDSWIGSLVDAPFACKMLKKTGESAEEIDYLRQELVLLGECQHEFVVQVVEKFETETNIYAVLGRCYGDMEMLQSKQMFFPLDVCSKWAVQLCSALAHCHDNGVIHRDVKKANLLLSNRGPEPDVLLGDFGFACKFASGEDNGELGTPLQLAPEVMFGADQMPPADAWAAGLTLYEIITGTHPFKFIYGCSSMPPEVAAIIESSPEMMASQRMLLRETASKFGDTPLFIAKFEEVAIAATSDRFPISFDSQRFTAAPLLREAVRGLVCRDEKLRATAAEAVEGLNSNFAAYSQSCV